MGCHTTVLVQWLEGPKEYVYSYESNGSTHCTSHINLCTGNLSKEADVRNMMDVTGIVARFFSNSPKRQLALNKHIDELYKNDLQVSK